MCHDGEKWDLAKLFVKGTRIVDEALPGKVFDHKIMKASQEARANRWMPTDGHAVKQHGHITPRLCVRAVHLGAT
jgi:hypothetical protein